MELIKLILPDRNQFDFQIALVDEPAIESEWMAFSKQEIKEQFKVVSNERRIVMGYAMIADKKIPRFSKERGAYNVIFNKESIDLIVQNFAINGLNKNSNEMHNTGVFANGVYALWSFQIDSSMGIKAPEGFTTESDGSWFIAMRVENDEVWDKVQKGDYTGFSIEGKFYEEETTDSFLKRLDNKYFK